VGAGIHESRNISCTRDWMRRPRGQTEICRIKDSARRESKEGIVCKCDFIKCVRG
jgi:hypothetical protein